MFKSVLFLNGTLPDLNLLQQFGDIVSIAADGGTLQKLFEQNHIPNLVIGDGDTLKNYKYTSDIQFILDEDQETTDFEKCLSYIGTNNLSPTLVCGIGGGEIDHQHNNLHCFVKYSSSHPMIFLDSQPGYKPKVGFVVHKSMALESEKGAVLSLLPFPEAKVSTRGLAWPLKDEILSLLGRSGARNQCSEENVCIDVKEGGPLLVVIDFSSVRSALVDGREFRPHSM